MVSLGKFWDRKRGHVRELDTNATYSKTIWYLSLMQHLKHVIEAKNDIELYNQNITDCKLHWGQ